MRTPVLCTLWSIAIVAAFSLDVSRYLVGCTPPPGPVAPSVDATDAVAPPKPQPPPPSLEAGPEVVNDCTAACKNLAAIGCKTLPDCAVIMCTANSDPRFHHYNTLCLAGATTRTDVTNCGERCE
jgi:hypothetical protein